jgi:AhpD family alkylhydroperoxidase
MRVSITPEQIRAAFEPVRGRPDLEESSALVAQGRLPVEMIRAMSLRPEILAAFGQLGSCVYPGGLLERPIKEFVIIEASRANQCQFCRDSHVALARMLGVGEDPLRMLEEPADLSSRERLAVEYTRAMMRDSNRVPDELFARLKAGFTDPEIVELTFLVGFINMLNLFNNALQVRYHGEYDALASGGARPGPRAR